MNMLANFMHMFAYCMHIYAYHCIYLYIYRHILAYFLRIFAYFMHNFCIFLHIIHIDCICLHILTFQKKFKSQKIYCSFNPTSWTTRSLPRSLRTTTGSHPPLPALSHRTHHQSLQPLPACCWGWFQCPPLEPMGAWTKWMWWAEHIGLAGCSCAHRSSQSSPCQSILATTICKICKICIWTWSMQFMQPGRLLPLYSSRTETKAQSCCFLAWSFCETKEKRNNTLQNQTLSILSWKPPLSMPGGRTMTISWRLDFWSCLPLKGQQQTRCSPAYFLWPIRRVEYILRCPACFADGNNCRVSKRARTWKYAKYAIYVY